MTWQSYQTEHLQTQNKLGPIERLSQTRRITACDGRIEHWAYVHMDKIHNFWLPIACLSAIFEIWDLEAPKRGNPPRVLGYYVMYLGRYKLGLCNEDT